MTSSRHPSHAAIPANTSITFEKKNHHYVPKFWQCNFRNSSGQLFGRKGNSIELVSPKNTMKGDWLYTVFDINWNPSDSLENELSRIESSTAALFRSISTLGSISTKDNRDQLCGALALQACRHPDIMRRGHRRSKEIGALMAVAQSYSLSDFIMEMAKFGMADSEAKDYYQILMTTSNEQIAQEFSKLNALSPQDSQLPEQLALEAQPFICDELKKMEITLLDATSNADFVLGDTPLPQDNLSHGFSIPISRSVAVWAKPAIAQQTIMARRTATTEEITEVNKAQWDNSLYVVVGPNKAVLEAL